MEQEFYERKVHLYKNQNGRRQRHGLGRPLDNTLCASNHGDNGLRKTEDPQKVTCKRCLQRLEESPAAQLEVTLSEMSNDLAKMEVLVELYRLRTERLERTLGFALDLLADNRDAVVHVPTMLSAGELIEAILADKVKEQAI